MHRRSPLRRAPFSPAPFPPAPSPAAAVLSIAVAASAYAVDAGPAWAQTVPPVVPLASAPLIVETIEGARHSFTVEVADTPAAQARGLMFRTELADDAGMLFVFERPREAAFWMQNTFIPLDIIYFDTEGVIIRIHAQTVPLDETTLRSDGIAAGAFEIRGGLAAELGVTEGAVILSPALGDDWGDELGG